MPLSEAETVAAMRSNSPKMRCRSQFIWARRTSRSSWKASATSCHKVNDAWRCSASHALRSPKHLDVQPVYRLRTLAPRESPCDGLWSRPVSSRPRVREWLNGIEPDWTLLDFDSFNALRHEPSRDKRAIRLSSRLSRHSASTVPLHG